MPIDEIHWENYSISVETIELAHFSLKELTVLTSLSEVVSPYKKLIQVCY